MSALTPEDRTQLGRMVVNLLDDWEIEASHQISMLGLPEGTRTRMLRRYQEDTPLPDDPAVMKHVEHLMGIADALRTTFPRNASIGVLWLKQPCRRLRRRRPRDIIPDRICFDLTGCIRYNSKKHVSSTGRKL